MQSLLHFISAGGNRKRNSRRSPGSHTLLSTAPANRLPGKNCTKDALKCRLLFFYFTGPGHRERKVDRGSTELLQYSFNRGGMVWIFLTHYLARGGPSGLIPVTAPASRTKSERPLFLVNFTLKSCLRRKKEKLPWRHVKRWKLCPTYPSIHYLFYGCNMLHAASPQSVTQLVSQAFRQLVSHHTVVLVSHSWS